MMLTLGLLASFGCIETTPVVAPTETSPVVSGYDTADAFADAVAAVASGDPGAYQLDVTLRSPDIGCDGYADWWEVLSPDGALLYRRILTHSHVDEQPFTRDGAPVPIDADTPVVIRGHMHPAGYGGQALQGSVASGFTAFFPEDGFAAGIERDEPQPVSCLF
jgi:hypothetical protein